MNQYYDYIIVGSGLWGATFAFEASKHGKKVLVLEKRDHIGGNVYTKQVNGINVHMYGAHIFNTDREDIWKYINQFAQFNNYINHVYAVNNNKLYSMPFNLATIQTIYGDKVGKIITPSIAKQLIIKAQNSDGKSKCNNLEEYAISLVGKDIYNILIKDYTEKQWGKPVSQLPPSIISRIPIRYTYDNNYYRSQYQGIPIGGYTKIIEKMLQSCDVLLNTDYFGNKEKWHQMANTIVYTGMIDKFYNYCFGYLEYRSLRFETEVLNEIDDYQGNAVINYTGKEVAYTRIIEHKHFEFGSQPTTIITREYPEDYHPEGSTEPFYPINDEKNMSIYKKYVDLSKKERNVIFGGRLGTYKYTNMQDTLIDALTCSKKYLEENK